MITPEMIEEYFEKQRRAVAALAPEERAWLQAEADHKLQVSREEEERRHAEYAAIDQLLTDDIKEYGEPTSR